MPYNRRKRTIAFSYFEILVVLVIIGILLSYARLQTSSIALSKNSQVLQIKLQNSIDIGLMLQATKNRKSVVDFELLKTCLPTYINIGYGGIVKPQKIICGNSTFKISPLGEVKLNNE